MIGVVRAGFVQAAVGVLERRSYQAFKGSLTAAALVIAIAGLIGLFGLADWTQGQRELIALRKECAMAARDGATAACEHVVPKAKLDPAMLEKDAAEKKAQEDEAAALKSARLILRSSPSASVAVRRVAACRVIVAANKDLAGDDGKEARQVALNRCVRAAK